MGEHIFLRTGPHNRTHEVQITTIPIAPKFIVPKEEPNIQLELATMAKEWDKLDEDCKRSVPFYQYFLDENKLKRKIISLYTKIKT